MSAPTNLRDQQNAYVQCCRCRREAVHLLRREVGGVSLHWPYCDDCHDIEIEQRARRREDGECDD